MFLAVDIGNTCVDLGLFHAATLIAHRKLETREHEDFRVFREAVGAFIGDVCHTAQVDSAGVASVVWDRSATVAALSPLCRISCVWIDSSWDLGIAVDYENPDTVGIDRLLGAAAAFAYSPQGWGTAVADAGTALTVDAVDSRGVFRGGLIVPGLRLSLQALHTGTRLLPEVELQRDPPLLGRSSAGCMTAGAVHGAAAMLSGIFDRLTTHLGRPLARYVTGGDGALLAPLIGPRVQWAPHLVLRGLALTAARGEAAQP